MRKVIVCNIQSLDGYSAGPGGNPLVLNMDAGFDSYNRERLDAADTVLLGADSFRMFSSYWPLVADAPDDPGDPALSDTNRAFSRRYTELPKVAVGDSLEIAADNPWSDTTIVLGRDAVGPWITEAREQGDGDILVFASRTLWNSLLEKGLVDEVHLVVGPAAVGAGIPTFVAPVRLELLGSRALDGSSNVVLRYAASNTSR